MAADRRVGPAWDGTKRMLLLAVVVMLGMTGWLLLQHSNIAHSDLHTSLEQHSEVIKRLEWVSLQQALHHANLTLQIRDMCPPTRQDQMVALEAQLHDLKGHVTASLEQRSSFDPAQIKEMQQQLHDAISKLHDQTSNKLDLLKVGVDQLSSAPAGEDTNELAVVETGEGEAVDDAGPTPVCHMPCVDVVFLFHEDDKKMFVENGVLEAARKHLKGVRRFFIVSKSNATFLHLLDARTRWYSEDHAPFTPASWDGRKSGRPAGWLFQQTLKLWLALHLPDSCNNLMFVDSDLLWLRDFQVVSQEQEEDGECRTRFKYNLSTQKKGAWDGDIVNPEYQHFVKWITGLPKAMANTNTAINHWQLMQRDVVQALERMIAARTKHATLADAMIAYGKEYNGMSEYEAYFSFAWYFYPDRLHKVHIPYIMREPVRCKYDDPEHFKPFAEKTVVHYFVCHDNFQGGDWYTNCKGRERECDPALVPEKQEEKKE